MRQFLIFVNNSIHLFLSYIFQKNHDKPPHTCGKPEFNNNDPKTDTAEEAMETDSVSETAETETEEIQENQDLNPVKG